MLLESMGGLSAYFGVGRRQEKEEGRVRVGVTI